MNYLKSFAFSLSLLLPLTPVVSFAASQLDGASLSAILKDSQVQSKLGGNPIQKVEVKSEDGAAGSSHEITIVLTANAQPCLMHVRAEEVLSVDGIERVLLVQDPVCSMSR